ncbi:nucleotidyltransferase family protein [Herbaspirillum lusitanum]|uniref:Nucleotidyltransferase family protein n=1 Tax=Herbaspirillum lusitanum TaxID=213312 RepID=A0ABW9A850_9BURK
MSLHSAVILAGGLGTRLRSAVPDLPKPMAPIAGRPFLEYQLDYWLAQGIDHFILSVGYRHEVIIAHFGNRYRDARLDYVIETSPLGTGGGVLLALDRLDADQPFLLLNGDTYFSVDLAQLDQFAQASDSDWCFSLFRTTETSRYLGMGVTPSGRISELKSSQDGAECLANGGVYRVRPHALRGLLSQDRKSFEPGIAASLENDIFPSAFAAGQRMFGMEFKGSFIDIGIPGDYHRAATILNV